MKKEINKNIINKIQKMLDIMHDYFNQFDVYRYIYENEPNEELLDEQLKKISNLNQYKKYAEKYYEIANYLMREDVENPRHSVLYTKSFNNHSIRFLNELYNYTIELPLEEVIDVYALISLIPEQIEKSIIRCRDENLIMFKYVNIELAKRIYNGKEFPDFDNSKIRLYSLGSDMCKIGIKESLDDLRKVKVL